MSSLRVRLATLLATAAASLVLASPAAAGYTTYWSVLEQRNCGYSDAAGIASGDMRWRGNYGYNRRYSYIYANGGYWSWGAYYTSGSYHNATHNQTGQWFGSLEVNYWSSMQTNPFIKNLNNLTVGAAGCFYWQ